MYGEAKKLYLIEKILKINDDEVLSEVEAVIAKRNLHAVKDKSFTKFAGIMSDDEADEMNSFINEGCETINPNDWK